MFIIIIVKKKKRPCGKDLANLMTILADGQHKTNGHLTKCVLMKY